MRYKGDKTKEISFPLGGIGTGCIGLAGNGRLIDWEIFGKPNKGGDNGFSFIAVKAERGEGNIADMRVLNGDLPPPYTGTLTPGQFNGFGFGPARNNMAGYPHFKDFTFDGTYPIAEIEYSDDAFPGRVSLRAFNPLIPNNDRDSTIPAGFFEVTFTNTTSDALTYTAAFTLGNPNPGGANTQIERAASPDADCETDSKACCEAGADAKRKITQIALTGAYGTGDCCGDDCDCDCGCDGDDCGDDSECDCGGDCDCDDSECDCECTDDGCECGCGGDADYRYGDICLSTDATDVSWQEYWFRGMWFDGVTMFWRDFSAAPRFTNRRYEDSGSKPDKNATAAVQDHCTLSARTSRLEPGKSASLRFVVSWNYPYAKNIWNPPQDNDAGGSYIKNCWKHYYATLFADSSESGAYALDEWDRLYAGTAEFRDLLYSDTLPPEITDAVSANISILKSPTCLRLEDGSFYAFEGCHCTAGCCEGSCTHVWNYAYALPFLFPSLERSMRDLNYKYNQGGDGSMSFRLQLPVGRVRSSFRPCADGQFGDVIKAYRDWKISGDTEWLRGIWAPIKRSIAFAWSESNEDKWDPGATGVLSGRQHHTLDMELFGPNAWLTGFYLAALTAAAEMAEALGEPETATRYTEIFEKGKAYVNAELWDENLGYFVQKLDLRDPASLDPYPGSVALTGGSAAVIKSARDVYWNDETGEIKYQFGDGCTIDQVLAQWHANIMGIKNRIIDKQKTARALASIHRNNFLPSLREHINPCRIYALNDEAGTVVCAWPDGCARPAIAAPYAEEVWPGCEYQVAAHMMQEGLVEEGLRLTKAVRERFDGEKRNPWNEFECGSNYTRSMSSYSLLLAYSGFTFDLTRGHIGFAPVKTKNGAFRCFWSLEGAWGGFEINGGSARITVRHGNIKLSRFTVSLGDGRRAEWTGCAELAGGDALEALLK